MNFEFLASFQDWESDCLQNVHNVDKLPREAQDKWTFAAQLLNTLAGYKGSQFKNLERIAKNGDPERKIKGFPGLLQNAPKYSSFAAWRSLCEPSPERLALLPVGSTLLRLNVRLKSPFYSRDDMAFYPTENVLRRDRVFDVPFLSAAGVKGLLRWAHRMTGGGEDSARFLFGNLTDDEDAQQGALHTWPLFWQGDIGMEIINPHDCDAGVGTVPIKYEVVKPGGEGCLWLLLVEPAVQGGQVGKSLPDLLRALAWLLQSGGLSAKQTAGWGDVELLSANAVVVGYVARSTAAGDDGNEAIWKEFLDADGQLKPNDSNVFTQNRLKAVLPAEWTGSKIRKDRNGAYAAVQELYRQKFEKGEDSRDEDSSVPRWRWEEGKEPKDLDALARELEGMMREVGHE